MAMLISRSRCRFVVQTCYVAVQSELELPPHFHCAGNWVIKSVLGSCRPLSTYQKKDKRYPHVHLAGRNHPDPYDDFAYNEQGQSGNDSLHEKLLR